MNEVMARYNVSPGASVRVLSGRKSGSIGRVVPTPSLRGEKIVVEFDHSHKDDFVRESYIMHPSNVEVIAVNPIDHTPKAYGSDDSDKNSKRKSKKEGGVEIIREKRKFQ